MSDFVAAQYLDVTRNLEKQKKLADHTKWGEWGGILCGDYNCLIQVDRSRDEKSIYCSGHINLKKCAMQG
jgi:hypothetical protein